MFSKSTIGQEHSALPLRNSCNPAVFVTPVYVEAQIVLVIRSRPVDITYWYFRYRTRKVVFHLAPCSSLKGLMSELTGRGDYIQPSNLSIKLKSTPPALRSNDLFGVAVML